MARCCDCHQECLICARDRCRTCYNRFYYSPAFALVSVQNPVRHTLSDVNPATRRATCTICGPVGVTRVPDYRGKPGYRCNTARNRIKIDKRRREQASMTAQAA